MALGWRARKTSAPRGSLRRYALFQIPGILLMASVLALGVEREWVSAPVAWVSLGLWIAKDIALYPALRHAYSPDRDDPGEALRGRGAIARDPLERGGAEGFVAVGPELWRAVLHEDSPPAAPGDALRVCDIVGMRLVVERIDS